MNDRGEQALAWKFCRGETRATGAWLPAAVAPVGAVFGGSCQVLALRAGRVSTVSVVFDGASGSLTAWKAPRADDRTVHVQFRRRAERWLALDPIDGVPEARELRVMDGRTFLVQDLLAGPRAEDVLRSASVTLQDVVPATVPLLRTIADVAAAGFAHANALHPGNIQADGGVNFWLTDPTTATLGRQGPGDVFQASGVLLAWLFGADSQCSAAAQQRWADAPAALRRALQKVLTRCHRSASARFSSLEMLIRSLERAAGMVDEAADADGLDLPFYGSRFAPDYQGSVHHGYQLLQFGCFELAEGAFRRALAVAPWSNDAQLGLAEALLQSDHVDESVSLTAAALSEAPHDARTWQVYAQALLATDADLDKVKAAASQAVRVAPFDAGPLVTLAQVHEVNGEHARADELRREALALAPRWGEPAVGAGFLALENGDHTTAINMFTRALRANPLDTEAWQGRALALEQVGAYAQAARSVEQLVAVLPESEEFRAWGGRLRMFGDQPDAAAARSAKVAQQALDHVPPVTSGVTPETRHDLETALGALEHTLLLRPDAVALWCLQGEVFTALGDVAGAETCFARAVELDPESGAAWLCLARARLGLGREAEGMAGIERAMCARRPMPAAGLLGAEINWRHGRRGTAVRLLEFTVAMAPAWAPAWQRLAEWAERLGDTQRALRAGESLSRIPRHRAYGSRIVARQLMRLGQADAAAEVCSEAVAAEPEVADTWAMLAEVQQARGELLEARRSLERALEYEAERADLWCLYAQTLLAAGDVRAAAAVAERATRLEPDSNAVWRVAGQVHLQAGHTQLARRAFGRALKQDITDAESWGSLAEALLSDDRPRPAMVAAERATAHDPERAEHWCTLGRVQLDRAEPQSAAKSFDRAISLAPDFVPAWHMLAVTEVVLGRYNAARRSWQRVLGLAPDHRAAREGLLRLQRLYHRGTRGAAASRAVLAGLPGAPHTLDGVDLSPAARPASGLPRH